LGFSWREPKSAAGPFTVTVEVAGPFRVESKPYPITAQVRRVPRSSNWLIVLIILLALAVVVGAIQRRKQRT
jgi:hypothetical protein